MPPSKDFFALLTWTLEESCGTMHEQIHGGTLAASKTFKRRSNPTNLLDHWKLGVVIQS